MGGGPPGRKAASRSNCGVRCLRQCRTRAGDGTSSSRHLRRGLLRLARCGYQPPAVLPGRLPRTYLVAGTKEPFFRNNATRWANALRDAGGDVVLTERVGPHSDAFWKQELPLMVAWAFGH